MKIIFVNRYFFPDESATSLVLTDLAFHLSGKDYDVHVITSRQIYDNTSIKLPANGVINQVRVHRVWTTRFGRDRLTGRLLDYLTFYTSAVIRLALLTTTNDIVVVKTDPPMLSIPAWLITRLRRARQINWLHDLFPEVAITYGVRGLQGMAGNILLKLRNFSLVHSCKNVVIGELMQQKLINEKVPANSICVIHNWSEGLPEMPVPRRRNPLVQAWGLEDKFIVAYSGNLGRGHDFRTIIAAARELREYRNIVFLIIGGGEHFNQIMREQQAQELSNMLFKPYQPRAMLKYSLTLPHVHLVTLASGMGGLMVPSKFYGIAAAGRPILFIGDANSEIPEIITGADCGLNITLGADAELVTAILGLQENPERLDEMGRKARHIYDEFFSSLRAYRQWEGLLTEVVSATV